MRPAPCLTTSSPGRTPWSEYFDVLEASYPPIRAIGATDYYLADTYEHVRHAKEHGRLPKIDLIFPNVELRLNIGTMKGGGSNVHLLVSPEHPEHSDQLRRFLTRLRLPCARERSPAPVRTLLAWAERPTQTSQTIQPRFATVQANSRSASTNFARNSTSPTGRRRTFWSPSQVARTVRPAYARRRYDLASGNGALRQNHLRQQSGSAWILVGASATYRRRSSAGDLAGLKPCLHGSDGHETSKVGAPDGEPFSCGEARARVRLRCDKRALIPPAALS